MRLRWLVETKHYDDLWRRYRNGEYALRIPLIVAGATVSFLGAVNAGNTLIALAGLSVVVLTGLEQLFRLGPRWAKLRRPRRNSAERVGRTSI